MRFDEIEGAARIAAKRVPGQWREDVSQEVVTRALELQSRGAPLTPVNVSALVEQVIDYAFRHWVHDQHGRDRQTALPLDTIVQDSEGNTMTLADALPSPDYFANVEEWALARLALRAMPQRIARFAAMRLMDSAHMPRIARAELQAWGKANL